MKKYDETVIGCDAHIALARKCAQEGITLIKNNGLLPLSKSTKRLIVLGKLGDKENIGDHGSSEVHPAYVVTPIQGIANSSPSTEVIYYNGEDLDHAKELAQTADAIVFVVGYDHDDEGEYVATEQLEAYTTSIGGDRTATLGLHPEEIQMIQEVAPMNENSIVVMIGGNMIMMEEWKESVQAILMAYYPGMEGGNAIGDILFGDVNPSGKLPFVIPKQETDLPEVNWETTNQHYDYYHGYAKLEKEGIKPSVPYGFGLSYTTFELSCAEFGLEDGMVYAECDLSNSGTCKGTEVMQLYIGFKKSSIDRPVKLLRGYKRVTVEAGEAKRVRIECPIEELSWFNEVIGKMEIESMEYEVYIGTSSDSSDLLSGKVKISA